jgi:hypothetical protein
MIKLTSIFLWQWVYREFLILSVHGLSTCLYFCMLLNVFPSMAPVIPFINMFRALFHLQAPWLWFLDVKFTFWSLEVRSNFWLVSKAHLDLPFPQGFSHNWKFHFSHAFFFYIIPYWFLWLRLSLLVFLWRVSSYSGFWNRNLTQSSSSDSFRCFCCILFFTLWLLFHLLQLCFPHLFFTLNNKLQTIAILSFLINAVNIKGRIGG